MNEEISFYKSDKEYKSINEITEEQLSKIKNYEDNKFNDSFINNFSLSFVKLARFPYDYETHFKSSSKKFMNWDIINYGNTSEDNYFFTLKNETLKTVIITFPGTLTKFQLLKEAYGSSLKNFDGNSNNSVLIGEYFGERAKNLFDIIFNEELYDLMQKNYQIIATGHSLGGAMAQCFMYFSIIKDKIKKGNFPMTITYGQPKVGNYFFANFLDKNLFLNLRFVNKNDLVQKIPLSSGFLNHIYYFFNYLDLEYTYYHTKNEKELRQILKMPIIVTLASLIFKALIFFVILYIILKPIIDLILGLYLAFIIDKEWDIRHWSIKYIIFLILFIIYILFFNEQNIISTFKKSKLLGILLIILYAALFYAFLIIICKGLLLSIVYKLIKKRLAFIKELEIKKFIKRFLRKLGSLLASSIAFMSSFVYLLGKIIPHLKYQYLPEGKIINDRYKKREILDSYGKNGCNVEDFTIYELPDRCLIFDSANNSQIRL